MLKTCRKALSEYFFCLDHPQRFLFIAHLSFLSDTVLKRIKKWWMVLRNITEESCWLKEEPWHISNISDNVYLTCFLWKSEICAAAEPLICHTLFDYKSEEHWISIMWQALAKLISNNPILSSANAKQLHSLLTWRHEGQNKLDKLAVCVTSFHFIENGKS